VIAIVVTFLELFQQHGPLGPVRQAARAETERFAADREATCHRSLRKQPDGAARSSVRNAVQEAEWSC
jgi:hypothetical protein